MEKMLLSWSKKAKGNADVKTLVEFALLAVPRRDFETVMEEGLDALLRLSSGLDMDKLNALQQASVCDMIPWH
jgi:hypothetical protein